MASPVPLALVQICIGGSSTFAIVEVFARVTSGVSWAREVTLPSGVSSLLVMAASGSI